MLRPVPPARVLVALALLLALGCGERQHSAATPGEAQRDARASAPPASPGQAASPSEVRPAASPAPKPKPPDPNEHPLPAFDGTTLDGRPFDVSSLLGRRALIFLFNPVVPEAAPAARAVARLARLREAQNFDVVGVALAGHAENARAFAAKNALDFAIVDDSAGRVAERLGLRAPVALIGIDARGNVTFAMGGPPAEAPDPEALVETQIREGLRLPAAEGRLEPALGAKPKAPAFTAERLEGGKRFELASLHGKPVVLIFFLYTCPHCHNALLVLKEALAKLPEASRPTLIGVSVAGSPAAVRDKLKADGLDYFAVVLDEDHAVRSAYGVLAGVPEIFLIDAGGQIASRMEGWRDDRDPALMRMRLAQLAGQPVPMLLHSTGYSGSDVCSVCHEREHDTWTLTQHSVAFDTLVRHGAEANSDCVGCHVVGWEKPGGYTQSPPTPQLEDVGCESCHGRGGPHLSPDFVVKGNYEPVCTTCHDAKHSLGFQYASFLPRISHAENAKLTGLALEQKRKLMAERALPRSDLLPATASYVGSEACKSCHAKEFEVWAQGAHAHALAPLEQKGQAANTKCYSCHVTALGRPGGFPKGASPAEQPDFARVGCESCHGPGGEHVKPDAARVGTIVSLGDKCNSCVILQICEGCHDQANDAHFEFSVEKKIEAQKHGTIEPAAKRSATTPPGT